MTNLNPLSTDVLSKAKARSTELSCEIQHPVDLNSVRQLHQDIVSVEKAQRMAEFFSLLGDANRLRILSALAVQELCVCDLAACVKMSESAVSHQLRALRSMRLVGYHKQGRNVFITSKTVTSSTYTEKSPNIWMKKIDFHPRNFQPVGTDFAPLAQT